MNIMAIPVAEGSDTHNCNKAMESFQQWKAANADAEILNVSLHITNVPQQGPSLILFITYKVKPVRRQGMTFSGAPRDTPLDAERRLR